MTKTLLVLAGLLLFFSQHTKGERLVSDTTQVVVAVVNEMEVASEGVSIQLVNAGNKTLVKAAITDAGGMAVFSNIPAGDFYFNISYAGYQSQTTQVYTLPFAAGTNKVPTIRLMPVVATLGELTVVSSRPFIQHSEGKVLINVEAAVTNTGTSVLEVLEKSPGVMVDKNGSISLQGKAGVLVMIDDKPTYLSGGDLTNLLNSMSSTQVDQIELMANPPAKYDASGNAGIINIKTKKNKQKGWNGTLTLSATQGRYPKSNNGLVLNYRNGRWNSFLTYSMNANKFFTDLYALRKYYNGNGALIALLDQPTLFGGQSINNTVKTGVDFYASSKTTIGISLSGTLLNRKGNSTATATWKNPAGIIDSAIGTNSTSANHFKNGGINLSLKKILRPSQELSVDADWLYYAIHAEQFFNNRFLNPGGYIEASRGNIPSTLRIMALKADHSWSFGEKVKLESGIKTSYINTNNKANYQLYDGIQWMPDFGKSNHFVYKENIHAVYSSLTGKYCKISMQAGLRYEYTGYEANQAGNSARKDSGLSRIYDGLFPSGYLRYQVDSSNFFTFTAGRRIDRPAFQKLNPFVFIINKYTYQTGNPFFLPQYSLNFELSHQYKSSLTTAVSFSTIQNYFSQLFLTDTSGILIYTEGNVGRTKNLGLSLTVQLSPFNWWAITSQALYNHKTLKGFNGNNFTSSIHQFNININNQFRINENYSAELSGFYTGRARNDLQELLYPTGQLSAGIARPVFKKKGTLKLSARDLFYTQVMEGITQFQSAEEYFILRRDTRVVTIAFTWRFGIPLKQVKRAGTGAGDEIQRVGSGS